jgi:cell wall-associated NlpC family hydrolase
MRTPRRRPRRHVATFTAQANDCLTGNGVPSGGATQLPDGFALPADTPAAVVTATGYDCANLAMMAYRATGIALPRTTYQRVYADTRSTPSVHCPATCCSPRSRKQRSASVDSGVQPIDQGFKRTVSISAFHLTNPHPMPQP